MRHALWILPWLILTGGAALPPSVSAQQGDRDKVRQITVYGNDPCPRSSDKEIVVCARRPESERQRIPSNLRELPPSPESESATRKIERLEMLGRTGVNSCSAVGPGGGTGCLDQFIRQWREERDEAESGAASAP